MLKGEISTLFNFLNQHIYSVFHFHFKSNKKEIIIIKTFQLWTWFFGVWQWIFKIDYWKNICTLADLLMRLHDTQRDKKKEEVTTYNGCGIIKRHRFIPHRIPHDLRYNSNNFQRFQHTFFFCCCNLIFYFSLNNLICYIVCTTLLFNKNLKEKKKLSEIKI